MSIEIKLLFLSQIVASSLVLQLFEEALDGVFRLLSVQKYTTSLKKLNYLLSSKVAIGKHIWDFRKFGLEGKLPVNFPLHYLM